MANYFSIANISKWCTRPCDMTDPYSVSWYIQFT